MIFVTGFPGFLASELLPRLLERSAESQATCLVQGKFAALARARVSELISSRPELSGRIHLLEGDITQAGLGLGSAHGLERSVTEIFHLAAIYDLSVAKDVAMRINVMGTRHMLGFAGRCPLLQRFQYISTCYVSGRHAGLFTEDDLEKGQEFNNFYEETKYLAEVDVQTAMKGGLKASIYRPSIVVGDHDTGATQKYDGPYYVIQWLLRQPHLAVLPVVGRTKAHVLNVVPRDFVVDAIAYLSAMALSESGVFHLADPNPLTVDELIHDLAHATRRKILRVPLPLGLAKAAIDHVPGVYRLLRIPSSAIDYFVHPARYATAKTQEALAGSGIIVPPFPSYSSNLARFVETHLEIGSAAMA